MIKILLLLFLTQPATSDSIAVSKIDPVKEIVVEKSQTVENSTSETGSQNSIDPFIEKQMDFILDVCY